MGARAFEVPEDKVLMASLLAAKNIKYRFVFEAMPGGPNVYRAEVEAPANGGGSGWLRFESLDHLIRWLAK